MAKKKRKKRRTGAAAVATTMKLEPHTGPSFSVGATMCIGASMYNIRERVNELAVERACGQNPVTTSAVVLALAELGLGWATEIDDKK